MANQPKVLYKTIDEYISSLPQKQRDLTQSLRVAVKSAAPEAVEVISYNMPAFKIYGRTLVYFAAHTNHIGFYPANVAAIGMFKKELGELNTSKGTVQFPFDKKIPVALVKRIVKFRAEQNRMKKVTR